MESLDGPTLSGGAHRRAERHLGGLVSRLVPRIQARRSESPRTPGRIAPTSIYALERIRADSSLSGTAIILLTSVDLRSAIPRIEKCGVNAHLTKPIRQFELRAAITKAIPR